MTYRSLLFKVFVLSLFLTCSISAVFGQHILAQVAVGSEPRGVGVNPMSGFVYVANVDSGTISVLRKASAIGTIPVDTLPYVVAVNSKTNRIYAAGCNFQTGAGSMVVVIDGNTNKVITDISLNQSCGLGTQGIAVNQFTNRVYVSDYDDNQEVVIDGSSNQIVARIDLLGRAPLSVAVDVVTNQVWVALDGSGDVDILDGNNNTLLETITVGNVFVAGVAIDASTRRVYVTSTSSPASLYVLNAGTRQVVATVPIGLFANFVDVDVLSDEIFVTDGQANTVVVVNGHNNQAVATVHLNGNFPVGVAANPVTRLVYVTEFESGQVEILTERP